MQVRLRVARVVTGVAGVLIAAALWVSTDVGWKILPALAVMIVIVLLGAWRLERRRSPELWVFASTVVNIQVMVALGTVMTGGPRTFLACMIAMPVVMVGARFSRRGLAVGAPVSALLIVASTVGVDPSYVVAHPESLAVPLALVICIVAYMSPIVAYDVRHRAHSTLDELNGLLNRRALEPRFAEVAEQAVLSGQPVSVVVADIDHFKSVNDGHGHAVGDTVLREVAFAMRRNLRTFELLYRLGGEEFLLLLPGADAGDAAEVAEKLRAAIESLRPEGLAVKCSFGVATARDEDIVFKTLVAAADVALYDAKRYGRNRVESALAPAAA
ncbi:MAG: two-component system, cell cycle response regulator [Solirubrobacteraceae bacterium]|nr:two-component system, cell cycle response regulator [Solirubrobacteraceae bacterium]